jgi:hypothetical protein
MTDFSIFTDDHLRAAEARLAKLFDEEATAGRLYGAASYHAELIAVRAELTSRAADPRKAEAA